MARGMLMLGYGGFGGRSYMTTGINSQTAPYGQLDELVERAVSVVRKPGLAALLSREAARAATEFGYEPF